MSSPPPRVAVRTAGEPGIEQPRGQGTTASPPGSARQGSTPTRTADDLFDDAEPTPAAGDGQSSSEGGGDGVFLAVLAALVGGLGYRYAYGLARFGEQVDAIGSTTRPEEVEPAGWKVFLTKLLFGATAVAGLVWLLVQVGRALV